MRSCTDEVTPRYAVEATAAAAAAPAATPKMAYWGSSLKVAKATWENEAQTGTRRFAVSLRRGVSASYGTCRGGNRSQHRIASSRQHPTSNSPTVVGTK